LTILQILQANLIGLTIIVALLSLCVGSFLNVVIYRLPIMLERTWRGEDESKERFDLMLPRSHCPTCNKLIPAWHNIPLLSYLILRGKCAYCKQPISIRYFLIELLTMLLGIILTLYFGPSWQLLAGLIFTWFIITLTFIDLDQQILPDNLTLSLLWIGLFCNLFTVFVPLSSAVIGAIAGYTSLWCFTYLYKLITGKMGMGHGDFKLFAAFGAWFGWQALPLIIVLAALLGSIIGIIWLLINKKSRNTPIAFGPFLALSGSLALLFHSQLLTWTLLIF
jgi:leader peptidase (prepilin peptidase)/N-methyltransferase